METIVTPDDEKSIALQKQEAYLRLNHAWQEALTAGIEPEVVAQAALFAALSDLVDTYGEDAVADYTANLAARVNRGEFSLPYQLN
jgi:succinylarginine dihydrolase